jgi:hypothetical protein
MTTSISLAEQPWGATPATAMNQSSDPRILYTLGMEGVSLALWTGGLSENLASTLDTLPASRLPEMRQSLQLDQVSTAVHATCTEAGAEICADTLADYITDIAQRASAVFDTPFLNIRLDVTRDQPCPKWHLDAVPARLLCTLRGPGTEFGPIGQGDAPQSIHRMTRGAVGIFRGALWPARQPAGMLHRSPPCHDTRLLLVIDPVWHEKGN